MLAHAHLFDCDPDKIHQRRENNGQITETSNFKEIKNIAIIWYHTDQNDN